MRFVAAIVLALALLFPAAAQAVSSGIVVTIDGKSKTFTAEDIARASDVFNVKYTVRGPSGTQEIKLDAALTLRGLIELAGADPDEVDSVRIVRPTGAGGTLDFEPKDYEADTTRYKEGPPIVWVANDDVTHALKPLRDQSDQSQVNESDYLSSPPGRPLGIEVFVPSDLTVSITASATKIAPGASVSFTAATAGGNFVAYNWDFGDGHQSTGAEPSHTFKKPGTYRVEVIAYTDEDSVSARKTITVTKDAPTSTPTPTTTPPPAGTGYIPPPTTTAPVVPPIAPSTGGGITPTVPDASPTATPQATATATPTATATATPTPTGVEVEGEIIDDIELASNASPITDTQDDEPEIRDTDDGFSLSLPAGTLPASVLAAVFAAGWLFERRRFWRQLWPD